MKVCIEIDIPEAEELIKDYADSDAVIDGKTVCRLNNVRYILDNPDIIVSEVENVLNRLIREEINRRKQLKQ